jgi:hypothetical protein
VNCFHAGVRGVVPFFALLGVMLAEQLAIPGLPGSLTWQNKNSDSRRQRLKASLKRLHFLHA